MATLTIKNVPDHLYERLKKRALKHRRSINQEAIVCLEEVLPLLRDASAVDAVVDELRHFRGGIRAKLGRDFSAEETAEWRTEGRA